MNHFIQLDSVGCVLCLNWRDFLNTSTPPASHSSRRMSPVFVIVSMNCLTSRRITEPCSLLLVTHGLCTHVRIESSSVAVGVVLVSTVTYCRHTYQSDWVRNNSSLAAASLRQGSRCSVHYCVVNAAMYSSSHSLVPQNICYILW